MALSSSIHNFTCEVYKCWNFALKYKRIVSALWNFDDNEGQYRKTSESSPLPCLVIAILLTSFYTFLQYQLKLQWFVAFIVKCSVLCVFKLLTSKMGCSLCFHIIDMSNVVLIFGFLLSAYCALWVSEWCPINHFTSLIIWKGFLLIFIFDRLV